jgi:mercuric reductase
LVIVGGGSAAFAAALKAGEIGAETILINDGLPIGGTCVNVGCVPSKTLIRAAEAHHRAGHSRFAGIRSRSEVPDFKTVIAQKRELVEELRQAKYLDVVADLPGFRRLEGRARLLDSRHVAVDGEVLEADRILVATGAAPRIPAIPGLADAGYLTNESAFELEELPQSLIVLGGRYVALESAQMFARFGVEVTVLQRSPRILPEEMPDLTDALTRFLREEGIDVVTGVAVGQVLLRRGGGVEVEAEVDGAARTFRASRILAATGRRPNTRDLGLETAGVELDAGGFVVVDAALRTSAAGVYAAGDVIGGPMYVYTAAYEGALAAANAFGEGAARERDYTALPWVIFTDPQVAGVGLDERQAADRGLAVDVAVLPLAHVPRSLAARDTRGFVKLIREASSDRLLGARILAPEGSELLMELSLAIRHGLTAGELASTFHPYLTLSEAVKLAAISFGKSVEKLSCCAA